MARLAFLLPLLLTSARAFYVPGVAPTDYKEGDDVDVKAVKMTSAHTQLPFEYYSLPLCEPSNGVRQYSSENLGQIIRGERIVNTPYKIGMNKNVECAALCKDKKWDAKESAEVAYRVEHEYFVHLIMDNLPCATRFAMPDNPVEVQYEPGYRLGYENGGKFYFNNHLKFVMKYHLDQDLGTYRVVGFLIETQSVDKAGVQFEDGGTCKINSQGPQEVNKDAETTLHFTYSVQWEQSEVKWASRWDVYLDMQDTQIHWFSIVNSVVVVFFLSGIITMIIIRTLRRDIAKYNMADDDIEESIEETGWKLVHGDVFRPPQTAPMLLCVMVGTGCQLCLAFAFSMLCAVFKLLNPVQKGSTLTALIILYVLCGSVAGYVSSRIYKFMDGKQWKLNVLCTAVGLPGSLVVVFIFLNIWLSFAGAATAASFFTIVKLFLLWICVSIPLVFVGAFFGFKSEKIEVPTKTNQIARVVPQTPWHAQHHYTILMGGVLPFGSVCIELAFIMSALWLHQIYYVMGFLLAVLFILVATCAQVAVVLTYLQLCAEDHRWWWTSFLQCASSGGYLFLYSLWFLSSRLDMVGILPVVVYLTYMGMISICFGLVCGSVGFLSAFCFNRIIYGAVKVD